MSHSRTMIVLVSMLAASSCQEEPTQQVAPTPKVLVIGIDGVRPDVLAEVSTPNIDALAEGGAFTDRARTVLPSVSGPSWSSLLIGVGPDKHGVTNNDFTGKRYDEYPDFLTRIEMVRPELSTFAVADWKPLVAADDGVATISDRIDVKHVLDGYETGWQDGDERSVELAREHLAMADPDALFVYLAHLTRSATRRGPSATNTDTPSPRRTITWGSFSRRFGPGPPMPRRTGSSSSARTTGAGKTAAMEGTRPRSGPSSIWRSARPSNRGCYLIRFTSWTWPSPRWPTSASRPTLRGAWTERSWGCADSRVSTVAGDREGSAVMLFEGRVV